MRISDVVRPVKEDDIQRTVVAGLRALGFTVLVTSRRAFKGNESKKGDGTDKGVPDLIVTHPMWHKYAWLGIEMKGPNTRISPEQADLAAKEMIFICRSWEDAVCMIDEQWKHCAGVYHGTSGAFDEEVRKARRKEKRNA